MDLENLTKYMESISGKCISILFQGVSKLHDPSMDSSVELGFKLSASEKKSFLFQKS